MVFHQPPFFMSTPVLDFREPVRAFLGDFAATVYESTAIDAVVRTVIKSGEMPGYAIATGELNITPTIATPLDYGRLTYKACLRFVAPQSRSSSWRTRAASQSFGDQRTFIFELHSALADIENTAAFSSYLDFYSWAQSVTGAPLWAQLTEMTVRAPVTDCAHE